MKDRVRSFMVFTNLGYRIIAYLAVPVLGIVIGHWVAKNMLIPGYLVTAFLLIVIEMVLDHFIFGGICAKDVTHLEYLKCSPKGERVIRNALIGGMVRSLLTMAVIFIGNQISMNVLYPELEYERYAVLVPLALLLSAFAIMMLGIIVGRFFDSLQVYYLLSIVGTVLEGFMLVLINKYWYVGFILSLVLAVGIGGLSVKIAMKRIKESYYDKTVTDGI